MYYDVSSPFLSYLPGKSKPKNSKTCSIWHTDLSPIASCVNPRRERLWLFLLFAGRRGPAQFLLPEISWYGCSWRLRPPSTAWQCLPEGWLVQLGSRFPSFFALALASWEEPLTKCKVYISPVSFRAVFRSLPVSAGMQLSLRPPSSIPHEHVLKQAWISQ